MLDVKITFLQKTFQELLKALTWDGKERTAYVLCKTSIHEEKVKLLPRKVIAPTKKDYVSRSPGHYELTKDFIDKAFNEAIQTQSDIIQCHVHPGDPAYFSGVDRRTEPEFMRHIAENIDGIIHGSIVFGNSLDTLDAWYFDRQNLDVLPIQKVVVIAPQELDVYVPKRSPLSKLARQEAAVNNDRTKQIFSEESLQKLRALDIGIVGASSLGAPLIEFIARDNYHSLLIADNDIIDETNLNRLPQTTRESIGQKKASFYAEKARNINDQLIVTHYDKSFYDLEVQKAFMWPDVIFGAVDSAARLSMNRVALANLIPYFDFGAGIGSSFVGGQMYSVIPGRRVCLACSEVFREFGKDFMTEQERELERGQGYLVDIDENGSDPLVMFLDYFVAGIGYYHVLKYLWGRVKFPVFRVHVDAETNKLFVTELETGGCIWCQPEGMLGAGDEVPPLVPSQQSELVDVPSKNPEEDNGCEGISIGDENGSGELPAETEFRQEVGLPKERTELCLIH